MGNSASRSSSSSGGGGAGRTVVTLATKPSSGKASDDGAKWKTLTSAALKAAVAAASKDSTDGCSNLTSTQAGQGGSARVCCNDSTGKICRRGGAAGTSTWSQWWLEANEITNSVFENITCKNITIDKGSAVDTKQSPCCMVHRVSTAVATALVSKEFTETERRNFLQYLLGYPPSKVNVNEVAAVASLLSSNFNAQCDNVKNSNNEVTATQVHDLYFGADASVTCDVMEAAVSTLNMNILCSMGRIRNAQCKISPESCNSHPGDGAGATLPVWAWALIALAAVLVVIALATALHVGTQHHAALLSGDGILAEAAASGELNSLADSADGGHALESELDGSFV